MKKARPYHSITHHLLRTQAAVAGVLLVISAPWLPAFAQGHADAIVSADSQPALKPDVPKLDMAPPQQKKPSVLRGGVQHSEQYQREQQKLNAGTKDSNLKGGLGDLLHLRKGKAATDNRTLRAKTKNNLFNAQAQEAIGIIGVKFTMLFGHAPIINRVFPGTPAFSALRVDDVIVAVDGVPTIGLTKEEVYDMIVGTPNTSVSISIQRGRDFQVYKFSRMDFNDLTDPVVRRDYLMSM